MERDLDKIAELGFKKLLEIVPENEKPLSQLNCMKYTKIVDEYCDNLTSPPLTHAESCIVTKSINKSMIEHEGLLSFPAKEGLELFNSIDSGVLTGFAHILDGIFK
jgi:hypothetical protein